MSAEDGLLFGLYLSLMIVMSLLTVKMAALSLLVLLLMLGVPFVLYWFVRRGVLTARGSAKFADTALHGIATFIFGTLIMSVVMYLYLKFIDPGYIADSVQSLVYILNHSGRPEDLEAASQLTALLNSQGLPATIDIVIPISVLSIASGSILALIEAPIALRNNRRFRDDAQVR